MLELLEELGLSGWTPIVLVAVWVICWSLARSDLRKLVKEAGRTPQQAAEAFALFREGRRREAAEKLLENEEISDATASYRFIAAGILRDLGDYPKAIAVHKKLRAFEDLSDEVRERATLELGLDFFQAGFWDLAEECFQKIGSTPHAGAALEKLMLIHFRTRSWSKAIDDYRSMANKGTVSESQRNILGHLYCEWASEFGQPSPERSAKLDAALSENPQCTRAMLMLGDSHLAAGDAAAALACWQPVAEFPGLLFLLPRRLLKAYAALDRPADGAARAKELLADHPSELLFVHTCAELREACGHREALELADHYLHALGGAAVARECLAAHAATGEGQTETYSALLKALPGPDKMLQCTSCGYRAVQHSWQCPQCLKWDAIVPRES